MMKKIVIVMLLLTVFSSCKKEKDARKPLKQETVEEYESDMKKNLNKYVTFKLTADVSVFTENERKMLPILINAANKMNELFWYESYGDKKQLLDSITDEETKQFVEINYGPWDRLNNNASFVEGIGEKPKGANYYPADMSKAEFDKFEDTSKSSLYTFVRRNSDGSLKTIPYHIQFASKVKEVLANCFSSGKLHDKSTPPTINVSAGIIINILKDIKNLGYCLPSSSCFFFANLLK